LTDIMVLSCAATPIFLQLYSEPLGSAGGLA